MLEGPKILQRVPALTRLTEAQREEIARKALQGEERTVPAREYDVTCVYVYRLVNRFW
jgi:hypothetical protein